MFSSFVSIQHLTSFNRYAIKGRKKKKFVCLMNPNNHLFFDC